MKKSLLLITMFLLLQLNASAENNLTKPNTKTEPILSAQESEEGTGGNPEVYIAHKCLKSESSQKCLEELFAEKEKTYLESYEIIKLASRGSSIEKATITFEDDELFLLYLDTSNVTTPLSTNIVATEISSDSNSVLFMFPVKNIGQEIIVKEKEGNIILQYKILRK